MNRYHYQFPKLYFLHIPKTAGTSLKYWLYDFYRADEVLRIEQAAELPLVTREEVNQARLVSGHFSWKMFEWLDEPRLSVTWLRDPVKRSLSNFNYIRQQLPLLVAEAKRIGRGDFIPIFERCQELSLEQMIDQELYVGFLDNLQVRHLANHFNDGNPTYVDESILNQAIRNLETLSFAGICEWMEQSVDLLCYQLGFPYHPLQFTLNVTQPGRQQSEADPAICDKLEYVERFDRKLYNVARTRFELLFARFWKQIEEEHSKILIRPEHFDAFPSFLIAVRQQYANPAFKQSLKQIINQKFSKTHSAPLVHEAELNFEDSPLVNNWYPRWPGKTPGSVVRWAGPENESNIFLPLEPNQDYEVMFMVENHTNQQFIETMMILVNQHPVPMKFRFAHDNFSEAMIWFLVPRGAINTDNHLTEVSIRTTGEIQPCNIDGNPKISFSTSGFRFRVSSAESCLTSTWLSDYVRQSELLERSNPKISTGQDLVASDSTSDSRDTNLMTDSTDIHQIALPPNSEILTPSLTPMIGA